MISTSAQPLLEATKRNKLLDLLKEKKARRGKTDLYFLNRNILGYKDMDPVAHGELCYFADKPSKHFKLILEPRGFFKSSCVTVGLSLKFVINNPNVRILIASEEFGNSKKFLAEIKGHFEENQEFIGLYGEYEGKKKWAEDEIIVSKRTIWKKEPTITCAGIDVTKVGMHYDVIIIDDPHSRKNIRTKEQIDQVKDWYKLLLSLLDPGGILIVIGTRWHYDDLFGWIIEQEHFRQEHGYRRRYEFLIKKAIQDDGTLLFPSRLSQEFLEDTKIDQGPYIFSCQYQNEPVDDETAVFKRSWVKFYDPDTIAKTPMRVYQIVDPARDEDGGDFTAIVTCGLARDWKAYILEIRRGKWDEYEVMDQMFLAFKKWKPIKIGFETVAFQKTYFRFIKAEMMRRGRRLPIVELKTDTRVTKAMRIKSMVPYWKSGLFFVPGEAISLLKGNMAIFANELTRYPKVANDDTVDALAYMDQLMLRPAVSRIVTKAPKGSFKSIQEKYQKKKEKEVLGTFNVRNS